MKNKIKQNVIYCIVIPLCFLFCGTAISGVIKGTGKAKVDVPKRVDTSTKVESGTPYRSYLSPGSTYSGSISSITQGKTLGSDSITIATPSAPVPNITKEIKTRKEPGSDNATSSHIIEKQGDETISITHQVKNQKAKTIHQHQTHIGKDGAHRQFPDEWVEYKTIGN